MRLSSLRFHLARLRRETGQRLLLGSESYRVRGYVPNRLTTSFKHEPHLLEPLARALQERPGTVIDIGVNTGQTLLKILSLDPKRPYVGFEPQIGCCYFVDQFLRDNDIKNARLVCLALSDKNRILPIYSRGPFDEMASLDVSSTNRYTHEIAEGFAPARIGDEAIDEMGIVDTAIIKIDVEGAEFSVLSGLTRTFSEKRPICFFEVLPNFTGDARAAINEKAALNNRAAAADIMAYFDNMNYGVRQIDGTGVERSIVKFDLDTPTSYIGSDYVAYPR
ncbi:MAG: hypothetical protein JWR80_3177 [Bradyrhizobium sp.]|nr:hypothetical protein [Bradyrhizobium sp.]